MKFRATALALSVLSACSCARQPERLAAADLFETACIDTGAARPAFEALGSTQGWRLLVLDGQPGGPDRWAGYDLGYARLALSETEPMPPNEEVERQPGMPQPLVVPSGVTCKIHVRQPEGGWRNAIAALAEQNGFEAYDNPSALPGSEVQQWDRNNREILMSRFEPETQVLSISLLRVAGPPFRRSRSSIE